MELPGISDQTRKPLAPHGQRAPAQSALAVQAESIGALVDLEHRHHHISRSRHVVLVQTSKGLDKYNMPRPGDVETHSFQCAKLVTTMMRHSEHFPSALDLPINFLLGAWHWRIKGKLPSAILHALLWNELQATLLVLGYRHIHDLLPETSLHALVSHTLNTFRNFLRGLGHHRKVLSNSFLDPLRRHKLNHLWCCC